MDALAEVLRVTAAGVGLAAAIVCEVLDEAADRMDPPPLDGYADFAIPAARDGSGS